MRNDARVHHAMHKCWVVLRDKTQKVTVIQSFVQEPSSMSLHRCFTILCCCLLLIPLRCLALLWTSTLLCHCSLIVAPALLLHRLRWYDYGVTFAAPWPHYSTAVTSPSLGSVIVFAACCSRSNCWYATATFLVRTFALGRWNRTRDSI
jgi:hypothetical protein